MILIYLLSIWRLSLAQHLPTLSRAFKDAMITDNFWLRNGFNNIYHCISLIPLNEFVSARLIIIFEPSVTSARGNRGSVFLIDNC